MSKEKLNSRNTENPYELISGIKLISKKNKDLSIAINASEFKYEANKKGKRYLVMRNFTVSTKYNIENNNDYEVAQIFKKIEKFANMCKNPLEVITAFIDAYKYKKNKNKIDIKIETCFAYPDMLDSKFVYNSLINN